MFLRDKKEEARCPRLRRRLKVFVVIFVIYTKNAAEWCPRELEGSSVRLFPAHMDYGMLNGLWNAAGLRNARITE